MLQTRKFFQNHLDPKKSCLDSFVSKKMDEFANAF